jgi:hypothetical protein
MSNAVGSEVGAYCRALTHHVESFVRQHWDWQGLPLTRFEQLNAGLLALAWQQPEPAGCRLLSLPPGATDEVDWTHVAAIDAFLRTQRPATGTLTAVTNTLKPAELVYCDTAGGTGWVAEVSQATGSTLRVRGLLEPRLREVEAGTCRRIAHYPYAGKNINGEFFSMKFLEWQQRIGQGVAEGRRILRQAQGFPQPNGTLAIIVTDTRPKTLGRLFEELPFMPAAYGVGTTNACLALPFAPRILLAASVKDARQLYIKIRQANPKAAAPHLYVEGRARYEHLMAELANEYAQDEWASVTLLGAEPETEATSYARWRWSAEELDYFFGRQRSAEEPEKVRLKLTAVRFVALADAPPTEVPLDPVAQFQGIVAELVRLLNALADGTDGSPAVRPRPVYYFLNAYLRHVLPPGQECPRAAAWLRSQHERIRAYLLGQEAEDEALGEQFADAFYEAGIFSNRLIGKAATELEAAFAKLNDFFQTDSPKHRHLTSSLKKSYHDNPAGGRYVLADRDTYEAVRATYHDPEKMVSVLRLHDNEGKIPSFQRIMRSAELNSTQAHFLVPFIFNREQYDTMSRARGQVKLFLYEQIEDGKFDNVRRAAERRDEARLLESGRRRFCEQSYEDLVASARSAATAKAANQAAEVAATTGKAAFGKGSQADFFAQLYAVDETGYARETQDRVIESRPYNVRFATGEQDVLEGSKNVLRQEDGGYIWRRISELAPGDAILFYENEDRNLNYRILLAQDKTGTMARIEHYSSLWKRTLRQLEKLKINEHILFRKLKQHGFPVAILSLHQYLQGSIRFPMHEASLRAIQALAREEGLADCALCEEGEFRALLAHRAKHQTLSKLLGRGLSDELLRYHVTEQRGPLLAALDDSVVTVLSRSIKSRVVATVQPSKA